MPAEQPEQARHEGFDSREQLPERYWPLTQLAAVVQAVHTGVVVAVQMPERYCEPEHEVVQLAHAPAPEPTLNWPAAQSMQVLSTVPPHALDSCCPLGQEERQGVQVASTTAEPGADWKKPVVHIFHAWHTASVVPTQPDAANEPLLQAAHDVHWRVVVLP